MTRRRSENVGWGAIPRRINAARAASDDREAERRGHEEAGRGFRPPRSRQHPNSALFERAGRVQPRSEEEDR